MSDTANLSKKGSNIPYLIAIVVMILIGLVSILVVEIMRPEKDNVQLIATIAGFIVPTTASILALMKSQETHLTVNSQLEQWKRDYARLMHAEGEEIGRTGEQARVAKVRADSVTAPERRTIASPEAAPVAAAEATVDTMNVTATGPVTVEQTKTRK